ncbi:MAG: DUF5018 domain-containing protein, partial [Bacteroidales bacterium]|nr:DUF5018 domain-containing protein [Bacteroidales bacterium]
MKEHLLSTTFSQNFLKAITSFFIVLSLFSLNNQTTFAQNYGLRDDGGVNLPTLTYWHSGLSVDLIEKGSEFDGKAFGELTSLFIKGASIKSWKSAGGDVTGATFSYKIWESTDSEPAIYTERAVNWSSDDGGGNQTWANFGAEIDATSSLAPGSYSLKILFSISGSGVAGTTQDGPFTATFSVPEPASSDAEILTFSLAEQTGTAVINSAAATLAIEVENGTALTNLIPTITVSANASVYPASGIAQDFSAPVEFTVTAEDLSEKVWTVTVTEAAPPAPNYGLRDDGGVNLPTLTYWHSDLSVDLIEKGSEFDGKAFGELTSFFIKGASIKSWKSAGGDVTGATFSYKIWESTDSEPAIYTERAVNWSSDDGGGNQTWANFGAEIDATSSLAPGSYSLKILFSISGSGVAGTTQDGPFTATFSVPEPASSDAEILTFSLAEQTGTAVINSAAATLAIEVENGTALTNLIPTITVSANASVYPASGIAQDFSAPVEFTVTAEDLSEKVWTVTVTEAAPPAPNYGLRDDGGVNLPTLTYWHSDLSVDLIEKGSEFDGKAFGELTSFFIKGASIKSWKSAGGDVTGATFSYKIWESTDSEPAIYTERAVNWSSDDGGGNQTWANFGAEIDATSSLAPGSYSLKILFSISGSGVAGTTQDGPFTATFSVPEPASSDAEILTFSLAEQTGTAVINSAAATVAIEVENGTALTNLIPTITVSANASVYPASGFAQDFSAPVEYTVTAEDLSEKVWTVTVTEAAPPAALALPYSNGLRTLTAYNQLLTDGFIVENSDYITAAGGYIKIFNGGYVETPLIDFTAYGIVQISFSSTTFGGVTGQTMAVEISENSGGSYTQLSSYTLTNSYSSYEYLLDLSGYPSQTGKLRFKMISGTNATRFRDLSLEENIPDPEIGFANLQHPASGAIEPLQEFNVYAQAYIDGITGSGTATPDLQAWIGYSTDDTDPSTWTNWIEADFSSAQGNNDEFFANLGAEMTTEGTFYYASRFKYLEQEYVYGGFDGGFWDGVDNVSGVLTVQEIIETFPVLFTVTDGTESYQAIEIKGSMTDWATVAMTESPDFVWTITLDIPAGTYEWGAIENDGSEFGIWLIDGGNLSFTVDATGNISGTVSYTIPAPAEPEIGFANLQYPAS